MDDTLLSNQLSVTKDKTYPRWMTPFCPVICMPPSVGRLVGLVVKVSASRADVGLVVKASASRAEGPGFESRLRQDFFGVES